MEVSGQRYGRSFTDSVGKSSAEDDEVFCQPCSSEGYWVVAVGYCQNCNEYFCAACLKPHRKQSMSRHHVILEGDHMPRPKISQLQIDPCSEPCDQHTNEIVKFYCPSHDAIGCSDCMVLDHKTCKVDRIQVISRNYFDSQEHKELVAQVDKFLNDLNKVKNEIHRNKQNINETYNRAVNDIKAFRKEVVDYLDKAEADILTEVIKRKQTDENIILKLEADKQLLKNEVKYLEEKLQLNKANELFVSAKKMKERMSTLDATLKQMFNTSRVSRYRFEASSELRHIIASKVYLGNLTESIDKNQPHIMKGTAPQHVPLEKLAKNPDQNRSQKKIEDMVPMFKGEICVPAQEEKNCCLIASAIISPTEIILVDNNNNSVKLVDIRQRKLLARYCFNTYPTDVARVSENTVAVTLLRNRKYSFCQSQKITCLLWSEK